MNTDRLTREQVLAMKPGRELDVIVDNLVLNRYGTTRKHGEWIYPAPRSRNIAAAWEVEEEIERQNNRVAYCQALKIVLYSKDEYVGMFDYVHASPADRCKAALLAVMDGEDEHGD